MVKKNNAFTKFHLYKYIKATYPSVQLPVAVEMYRKMFLSTKKEMVNMHFI